MTLLTSESQTTGSQTESFLSKIIKEKGENWKDPEVLAKGKLDSDEYIKNLEGQLKELTDELGKQDYTKTLLEEVQKLKAAGSSTAIKDDTNSGNTSPAISDDKIKSLVEATLSERDSKTTRDKNVKEVETFLTELWGTEAKKKPSG